ncbi:MAG: hypothetical protein ACYS7Y_34855 [Planctomycetota bacterium]
MIEEGKRYRFVDGSIWTCAKASFFGATMTRKVWVEAFENARGEVRKGFNSTRRLTISSESVLEEV